jgi:pteridine reductase
MNADRPVALVTGGARRLGARFVRALVEEGFAVAFSYFEGVREAESLVDELGSEGHELMAFAADLRDASECEALIEAVHSEFGVVDCLVNNAGVLGGASSAGAGVEEFDATMAVNLRAPWILSRSIGSRMKARGEGSIINVASVGGLRPYSRHLAYSVSKAGLIMLTRGLARDLAPEVRVNAIAPGMVDLDDEREMPAPERVPLGSWARPEDLEDALLYLVDASYVTGQVLAVDGGWSLRA